jgi:Flp pilus assembly protein TadD/2-polyprenyl-3-methyl-5-hydroxy-6-metoxy-1,4-benzoquinol methylase
MELTIEQALQQGVAAHKEGKLQDAERLYRAILQSQPLHPDANHNLGVIAVSVNQTDVALPLFKTALDGNPKVEQFWLSYIDALIKEKQFDNARAVLEQAKNKGVARDKVNAIEAHITTATQLDGPKWVVQKKSLTLSQKRKKLVEQKKQKKAKKQNLKAISPSESEIKSLLEHYQNGRYDDAEKLAKAITQQFPSHLLGWKVLGALLKQTGRASESLAACQKSVQLVPQDPESHNNLGVTLQDLGRLDEAQASYTQAIALKPDFAGAHSNLGNTLKELGRLDEACSAYIQAINLNPGFTDTYVNLAATIKNRRFNSSNVKLYPPLIRLLSTGNFARPADLAPSILSLLKHDPLIKDLLLEKNFAMSLKEVTSIIGSLDKLRLLHHLMRVCPLPELQFEGLFVAMRSFLLSHRDKIEVSAELIYFLSTLSLHCFVNEYVYAESDEEIYLVEKLEDEIMQTITKSEQPEAKNILCLASYRPLHQYNWCQKLEALDNLEEVKKRLIEEPLAEKVIAADIPMLGGISDDVSLKVRAQYEESPYPRWVKTRIPTKAKSISEFCADVNLHLHSESIKNVMAPAILIAGCGTGQHSIGTAPLFSDCQVTAVDLSLASLAYAQRKTAELGMTNLEYLQADILKLDQLEQEFDIIESAGVLHHMDEPMAGWRVLTDLLKPGGLMKIGLYSELARQHIVRVREEIALLTVGTSEADIRRFRGSLAGSHNENHQLLTTWSDFFSLSTLRDLIFHVQEHRFTLPQIRNCLDELGLKFCGFENEAAISNFRELHGKEADIYDLVLWHQYEERNPHAFAGMYQFWCQKP